MNEDINKEASKEKTVEAEEEFREPARKTSIKAVRFFDAVFWVIESCIIIRFIFKLVGANTENSFVKLIYDITNPFVAFFQGIVNDITTSGGNVFEISALITLVVLWLLYLAIIRVINVYAT